jgi:hypothetical protein
VAKQSSKLPKGTASSLAVVFFRMALAAWNYLPLRAEGSLLLWPSEQLGGRSECCDEVCTDCSSVLLFLIRGAVWNTLGIELPVSRIFMKLLLNCLLVKVQLTLHFCGHMTVYGHQVTNCCNCVDHHRGLLLNF